MANLIKLSEYKISVNPQTGNYSVDVDNAARAITPASIRLVTELSSTERARGIPRIYAKVVLNDAAQTEFLTSETVDAIVTAANA